MTQGKCWDQTTSPETDYWYPRPEELDEVEAELRELQEGFAPVDLIVEMNLEDLRDDLRYLTKERTEMAKNICRSCPVKQECLEYAISNDESQGIWGGCTPRERSSVKRKWLKEMDEKV